MSPWQPQINFYVSVARSPVSFDKNTPNANMADHSVIARDELHESEASEASVFCFDNASPENMPTSFSVLECQQKG